MPYMTPPVLLMHSKQDKLQPYKAGKNEQLVDYKTTVNNLKSRADELLVRTYLVKEKDHRCESWKDRIEHFEILSCTTDWGGNTIPGTKFSYPKKYGKVMPKINGIETVMTFFERHAHHEYTVIRNRGIEYYE